MSRSTYIIASLLSLTSLLGCSKAPDIPISQRYPGPWRSDFNKDITHALAKNNILGCGEYKHRESSVNSGEFLVLCSNDGLTLNGYLVWPRIGSVTGPIKKSEIPQ